MKHLGMRFVVDENIPFAEQAFAGFGEVVLRPGRQIEPADVHDADVLLVRSVTRVDAALLAGSRVRMVGSATIGTDHVDRAYLDARGIGFAHAPGSNADSVVEYVLAVLLRLAVRRGVVLRGRTVGVVGCGQIGERLAQRLPALGLRVLRNDPPLAEAAEAGGRPHGFVSLARVLDEADIVTLHVPLTREGPHATHHLFGAGMLRRLQPEAWLLNAARGPAIERAALLEALRAGRPGAVVLDVWEGEPDPDPGLLRRVDLATPHIAGYSYDGKVKGTEMLYEAVAAFFGSDPGWTAEAARAPAPTDRLALLPPDPSLPETDWLDQLVRQLYDVGADDARLRALLDLPPSERVAGFIRLRKEYPRRRAFERHYLPDAFVPEAYRPAVREGLRVGGGSRPPGGGS